MGEMRIIRFAGDTYPEVATITVDGKSLDPTTNTVKMYIYSDTCDTIISDGIPVEYFVTEIEPLYKYEFQMNDVSLLDKGKYRYEIKVFDGTYTTTFVRDIMEIV